MGQGSTIKTADTSVQVEPSGSALQITSLKGIAGGTQWVGPGETIMPLAAAATIGGKAVPLTWRLIHAGAMKKPAVGHVFVFACRDHQLEVVSIWKGDSGPGPVEHELSIANHGKEPVELSYPASIAFAARSAPEGHTFENWWIEKGAGRPGDVGVHRVPVGKDYAVSHNSTGYANDETHEPIPWTAMHDPQSGGGWYLGLESSAQVQIALQSEARPSGSVMRVKAGVTRGADSRFRLAPGETLHLPPVFIGCFAGDLDAAGNRLRKWLQARLCAPISDPHYPLLVNNSWGSGMAVDEKLARTMINESADLGLEMFHIDAGWFRGVGDWFPDRTKFPESLAPISDYAHSKGLKFGLWVGWTQGGSQRNVTGGERPLSVFDPEMRGWFTRDLPDDWKPAEFTGETVCLACPAAEQWCLATLRRIVKDYKLDLLEHDQRMIVDSCSRADHHHTGAPSDVSAKAAQAYYRIYDTLRRENPGLLFENCVNGGRMVDFGALRRSDYISITDTYDPLSNRRAFYDASYVIPPAQCESYIEHHPGKTLANFVYMIRSGMMGWCTIMTDTSKWTPEQRAAAQRQFALYKTALRPLILKADLYHVSERPDGVRWDGMQYWNETTGKGALFVFRGTTAEAQHRFLLKALKPKTRYRVTSQDSSVPAVTLTGTELVKMGLQVLLPETESSDIILIERVR